MSIATPNLVEADEIARNLPDMDLRKAASFGHAMVPPIVALGEITRRKEMRDRYQKARNNMPEATIKDQILGANPLDMGVMANVPQRSPQMASRPPMPQPPMNPQMMAQMPPMPPQMPPQMSPQGMMPQMASTGAVVKASQGMPVFTYDRGSLGDIADELQRKASSLSLEELNNPDSVFENPSYDPDGSIRAAAEASQQSNVVTQDLGASLAKEIGKGRGIEVKTDNLPVVNENKSSTEKAVNAHINTADMGINKGNALMEDAQNYPSARQERKEMLELAREEAFKLSDDDIAAFKPSKDDILSDFLMKYGAELAGGDHAEGLRKGVAAVGARKKEARSADQLQMLTNLKLKQKNKTNLLDSLYKAGSLDISELSATMTNEVEMGRTLRALVDAYQHLGNDSTWISSLDDDALKDFYDERKRAFQRLAKHDEMMRKRLYGRSTGGIASIR